MTVAQQSLSIMSIMLDLEACLLNTGCPCALHMLCWYPWTLCIIQGQHFEAVYHSQSSAASLTAIACLRCAVAGCLPGLMDATWESMHGAS